MGHADAGVVDLPIKMGGEAPEAVHFYDWGMRWCHLSFTGWSSMAMEVKLSAAVATHSIPLQYVHKVLYQCCSCSSPPPPPP